MHVVATAGHVDHGKSTLVRALTGQDPDRLEEERRRGLSIQLGYCWTALPDLGDVAFVDVPGHERFIATTLAGMGPVPAALLVVAADDPWMPQAAEHLAALDLLDVRHGVLVVTRSDLADPGPALARAQAEVARTSLRDTRAVVVSGRTGAGLEALRTELAAVLATLPAPDRAADVRLWVDRRFTVRGTGTVVTGTLPAGTVTVGDTLLCEGRPVRVRGIESLGRAVNSCSGVARVALALSGRAADDVGRSGVLVAPDAFEHSRVIDVRVRGEERLPERPVLHVGATSVGVHARPLSPDLARLTLERALPLRIGDRALLRDPGSRVLWGVRVLDPAPPSLRRRGAAARRVAELAHADGTVDAEVARRLVVERPLLERLGATGVAGDEVLAVGPWLVAEDHARHLRERLREFVDQTSTPHRPGVPLTQVAQALSLPDERLVPPLVDPPLEVSRGMVVPAAPSLPQDLQQALDTVRTDLDEHPFAAPDADRLRALGLTPADLGALAGAGHLVRLAEAVVLLPGADEEAVRRLTTIEQPFTVSQARTALGTTRRVVLPLLAHLDRTGRTVRLADDRRRVRR